MTAEDQVPIVEVDDSYSSSLMQDFLWFTKVQNRVSEPSSEVQSTNKRFFGVSAAVLHVGGRPVAETEHVGIHVLVHHPPGQAQDADRRQPAAGEPRTDSLHLVPAAEYRPTFYVLTHQNLLGTHNLGRVHYEPIKDRHGNVLLVTIRDVESQHSLLSGKWMQVTKLQSQRKSLSTPEEPYALDILIITMQARSSWCEAECAPGHGV